jgi:hypothetical protein
VNRERADILCAMAHNALGQGEDGVRHARAGLALLDEFDQAGEQNVDRAFLTLELATALRLAGRPDPGVLARAQVLAAGFGAPGLDRWFAQRVARNEAIAAHYAR